MGAHTHTQDRLRKHTNANITNMHPTKKKVLWLLTFQTNLIVVDGLKINQSFKDVGNFIRKEYIVAAHVEYPF